VTHLYTLRLDPDDVTETLKEVNAAEAGKTNAQAAK